MKTIVLDRSTTLHLSADDYAVILAYANLFCNGDVKRAAVELARKKQRARPDSPERPNKSISHYR